MLKKLTLLIVATLIFEPLFVASALATRTGSHGERPTTHLPGLKKSQYKTLRSRYLHQNPQTKFSKKQAQIEQKNTINAACLVLAGMLAILPSVGLLASALAGGK
jgi:hypothetical protein